MSEEEKKAIDYLKNDVVYWLDKGKDFVVIDIGENDKLHSILNLIDKQQKEIEKYEQQIDLEFVEKNFIEKNKVVSKDKIRERIKELESKNEENKSELAKGIDRLNFDIIENAKNNIAINVNVRDILKELLEENNAK